MRNLLATPITGAVTIVLATIVGAIGFAGPWLFVGEDVVTLTGAQRDWVVAMWLAALAGGGQAFWALLRQRNQLDTELRNARAQLESKRVNQEVGIGLVSSGTLASTTC
jgi:hypothetical protein